MNTLKGNLIKATVAILALTPSVSLANTLPFKFRANCFVETPTQLVSVDCTVVETREPSGALKTRSIYSNRLGLTIKSRFDSVKGFVTWDSHNKFEYKWEYKVKDDGSGYTYIMPGFLIDSISWD
jgi:hypothetical protein